MNACDSVCECVCERARVRVHACVSMHACVCEVCVCMYVCGIVN